MSFTIVAKGLLTFVLPPAFYNRSGGRTQSPRYCYSVLLRHWIKLRALGVDTSFRAVAEIGPGESVGTGLAALAAGAERYVGLDIKDYGDPPDAAAMLDSLADMLRGRASVPGHDEFPTIKPEIESHVFPDAVLTQDRLAAALAEDRIADLKSRLAAGGAESPVVYSAPWFERARTEAGGIDWIFSQAAMEHVDDLAGTYAACREWLAPGGVMSHQIDFKSHGTAAAWNGHWGYADTTWRMIRGARLYLINRQPLSAHLEAIAGAGLELVSVAPVIRDDGLARNALAPRFRTLSDDDLRTAGAFVVARKPETPH